MIDRQTLLGFAEQLSAEIRDGEAHAAHLRYINADSAEIKAVEADVAYLRREHRTTLLRGYFLVTGSVVPDAEEPAMTKVIRAQLKSRMGAAA